jgi:predicted ATP-binding protein involved in virulence
MMNLQSLKIKKLFGQFDYDISVNKQEGITILTGPNGYGKTTVLNIIYHFFQQNFFFFQKLNFDSITFCFSENRNIILVKKESVKMEQIIQNIDGQQRVAHQNRIFFEIHLFLEINQRPIESYKYTGEAENRLLQTLQTVFFSKKQSIPHDMLVNTDTGKVIDLGHISDLLLRSPQKTIELLNGFPRKIDDLQQLLSVFSQNNVYLIKEQRLLKTVHPFDRLNNPIKTDTSFSYTIQNYALELRNLIQQKQVEAFQEAQKLDNTFPERLMQNSNKLSPEEFKKRFTDLTEKQQGLQQFGITVSNIQVPEYKEEKADVLSVYLDDAEKKAGFFDELADKINLFVTMINEKEFAHKRLMIDRTNGFYFISDTNEKLELEILSSGEQEETVILYELLFKTQENALVLIDEPEISLHVSWQKSFIKDLLSISKIRQISFLAATHSPQIINSRWDLVTDLYQLSKGEEYLTND